ncbi:MAG: hypothetical protein M3O70_11140 [Actinomycetota bacterium]|nr:hypothetical protein [Actinomycetota bacterium]
MDRLFAMMNGDLSGLPELREPDRGVRQAARLRTDLARTSPLGYGPRRRARPAVTLTVEQLARLAQPIQLTRAKDDPRIPRGRRRRRRGRPDGEPRVIAGGHIPWLSQPDRLAHRMIVSRNAAHMKLAGRFLRKHTPRAAL